MPCASAQRRRSRHDAACCRARRLLQRRRLPRALAGTPAAARRRALAARQRLSECALRAACALPLHAPGGRRACAWRCGGRRRPGWRAARSLCRCQPGTRQRSSLLRQGACAAPTAVASRALRLPRWRACGSAGEEVSQRLLVEELAQRRAWQCACATMLLPYRLLAPPRAQLQAPARGGAGGAGGAAAPPRARRGSGRCCSRAKRGAVSRTAATAATAAPCRHAGARGSGRRTSARGERCAAGRERRCA